MWILSQSVIDLVVERFISLRYEKGWSQGQAARILEVDKSLYSKIERKDRNPSQKTVEKMCYFVLTKSLKYSLF